MLNSQVSGVAIQLRLRCSQSLKSCELQKPIPNHQSSFCWICLPLLTPAIIRSSCPPSHHWTSLGLHFSGLNPISLIGLSGWSGAGRYPKHINWLLGIGFWTPPLLHIHYITGCHHTGTWFLLPLLRWWHTGLSLFSTRWPNGSSTDLRLPCRHLGMDERTSSTAQPGKDWASCLSCHSNSTAWLHDSVRFINNYPISFGQKSWRNLWWPADLQRAGFKLHNIRKIRPFLTEHAAQLLVQALVISRLDYLHALLAGLPSHTIKPLQMIQNAAAQLVFNEPKGAHVTPLFISLHWLPVAARIQFKTLILAYKTTTGSTPAYFHSLLRIYIPSRILRSASERRLVVPSQRVSISFSRTFSFTTPGWWNDLPTPIRNAGSLSIVKQQLKTHLFRHYLTSS